MVTTSSSMLAWWRYVDSGRRTRRNMLNSSKIEFRIQLIIKQWHIKFLLIQTLRSFRAMNAVWAFERWMAHSITHQTVSKGFTEPVAWNVHSFVKSCMIRLLLAPSQAETVHLAREISLKGVTASGKVQLLCWYTSTFYTFHLAFHRVPFSACMHYLCICFVTMWAAVWHERPGP